MKHFKSTIHLSSLLAHARFARKAEAFSNCAIVYTVPKKIQEVVEFIDVNFHDTNKLCMYKSSSYHREKDHKEKVTLELYFFRAGYIQYAKQMRKFRVTEYTRNHDIAFLVFFIIIIVIIINTNVNILYHHYYHHYHPHYYYYRNYYYNVLLHKYTRAYLFICI